MKKVSATSRDHGLRDNSPRPVSLSQPAPFFLLGGLHQPPAPPLTKHALIPRRTISASISSAKSDKHPEIAR